MSASAHTNPQLQRVPPRAEAATARRVGPGRPRQAEAQRREQVLVEIAARMIARRGYRALSLESIAREAHVAARTIYSKFGGKAGLFAAVIRRGADLAEHPLLLEDDRRPLRDALRAFSRDHLWTATRPAAVALRRAVLAEAAALPEVATIYFEQGPTRTQARLAAYFERPDVRKQLRAVTAPRLAAAFQSVLYGYEYQRLVFGLARTPTRRSIAAWADAAVELFLEGASAETTPAAH
ncbi:MAG TPA: TetR/AcrR family transcriptional regulator [Burkholderiaceae bacterium]|nr:TetR/AcrR family transcriptional regulator [Burkholderiaceae bacterium]